MESNFLVTVLVLSYNSGEFILETLESIKNQSYKNIEIILSDDASKDDTILIASQWFELNKKFFVSTKIIQSNENTGTSANANRGLREAKGTWLKIIAADDLLFENCISDYVQYIVNNPNVQVAVSTSVSFKMESNQFKILKRNDYSSEFLYNDRTTARQQFLSLIFNYKLSAPTFFLNVDCLNINEGFDEDVVLLEDTALSSKLLIRNIKIYYLNKETVYYRVHESSVSRGASDWVRKIKESDRKVRYEKYIKPNVGFVTNVVFKIYYKYQFSNNLRLRRNAIRLGKVWNELVKKGIIN